MGPSRWQQGHRSPGPQGGISGLQRGWVTAQGEQPVAGVWSGLVPPLTSWTRSWGFVWQEAWNLGTRWARLSFKPHLLF